MLMDPVKPWSDVVSRRAGRMLAGVTPLESGGRIVQM
jgi:hypothetical protein